METVPESLTRISTTADLTEVELFDGVTPALGHLDFLMKKAVCVGYRLKFEFNGVDLDCIALAAESGLEVKNNWLYGPMEAGKELFERCFKSLHCGKCGCESIASMHDWKVRSFDGGPFSQVWTGRRDSWCKQCRSKAKARAYKSQKIIANVRVISSGGPDRRHLAVNLSRILTDIIGAET